MSMINEERASGHDPNLKKYKKNESHATKHTDTIDSRINQNLRNNLTHKGSVNTTLNNTYIGDQINQGSGSQYEGSFVLNNPDDSVFRNPLNSTGNFAYSP